MHVPDKISIRPASGFGLKSISVVATLSLFLSGKSFAQFTDDFSDGDFTLNPSWVGTTEAFVVNAELQLQLNATEAGTSWLSADFPTSGAENMEWQVFVKQSFSPSGGNFSRVYLMSDQPDLTAPLNGYYLQFGEAGSEDAVELFRQSGTARTSVCRATNGAIAAAFAIRVKVVRTADGLWELSADYTGGTDFVYEGSGTDLTHSTSSHFGVRCTYTVSNIARFTFDDITISATEAPDTLAPGLLSVRPTDSRSLCLLFSEPLERSSAENIQHYFVSPSPGYPASSELMADQRTVLLSFSDPFANGYESLISVQGVADVAGNASTPTSVSFLYFQSSPVHYKDVVITEIHADPTPPRALPEAEFVEILNRSDNPIELAGWKLADDANSSTLQSLVLLPGEYLILTSVSAAENFHKWGKVLAVNRFPTINNAGDVLSLWNSEGEPIDSVRFSSGWYHDDEKKDGGWSLEIIDPEDICAEATNWVAAETDAGGTPGRQNSVWATRTDNMGPKMVGVVPVDPGLLLVTFDEKLEHTLPPATAFMITPVISIDSVRFASRELMSVYLHLVDSMKPGTTYFLQVSEIFDCAGNRVDEEFSTATFVLPERAEPGDIIVNEVLFNPKATGVDFVEVYNRSGKVVDLKGWTLYNPLSSAGTNTVSLRKSILMYPHEYKIFTLNANVLKGEYVLGREENFVEMIMPALSDAEGSIVLMSEKGERIDSMYYEEDMHSPFVRDPEGVSLERISFETPAELPSNWRSASSVSGFATPGYENSNLRREPQVAENAVIVEPELIRREPSWQSFAQIRYRFDRGGFMANVKIIDAGGRTVRELAGNELLGTEGFFRWDGDLHDGSPARRGYYMVWFEVFDETGLLTTVRKRVAVF